MKARIAAQEKDINLKEVNIENETVTRELKGNNSDLEERVKRSENEAKELRKVVSDKSKQLHNVIEKSAPTNSTCSTRSGLISSNLVKLEYESIKIAMNRCLEKVKVLKTLSPQIPANNC